MELAKQEFSTLDEAALREAFGKAKETDTLKKVLMPHFDLGPALLEHLLLQESLRPSSKLKEVDLDIVLPSLLTALQDLSSFLKNKRPSLHSLITLLKRYSVLSEDDHVGRKASEHIVISEGCSEVED